MDISVLSNILKVLNTILACIWKRYIFIEHAYCVPVYLLGTGVIVVN